MRFLIPFVLLWPFTGRASCQSELALSDCIQLRECLKPLAREDTAYDVERFRQNRLVYPLAEHCGCVATVVNRLWGGKVFLGRYVTSQGQSVWHVFNRITVNGTEQDVDLTKQQFGLPEDSDSLRPPPMKDVIELAPRELRANDRLRLFLKRYLESLERP